MRKNNFEIHLAISPRPSIEDLGSDWSQMLNVISGNFDSEKNKINQEIDKKKLLIHGYDILLKEIKAILIAQNHRGVENDCIPTICEICCVNKKNHALPCGHLFCLTCIRENTNPGSPRGSCPECRSSYHLNDPARPIIKIYF